ncbi:hypothetical protein CRUP_023981 [Coryphaenoides rupestris]|nr:hypothetical protein CRUP_023981 [Coryphaenoides rupestris]
MPGLNAGLVTLQGGNSQREESVVCWAVTWFMQRLVWATWWAESRPWAQLGAAISSSAAG